MHYNKCCRFFWHCIFFECDKFRNQFLIHRALSTLSVNFINGVLCWDYNIIIDLFAVQNCWPRMSVNCAAWRKLGSVEEKITAAIKNTVDLRWIRCSGWSLHHQHIVDGIAQSVTRISIPW
jgi:uncharacterized membrane protein YccF (DUF307 family)